MITTTHGIVDESTLQRTLGFEERPREFVVWVEWRRSACPEGCTVCTTPGMPQSIDGQVLVRRDAHVILKEGSAVATALVGELAHG